MKTSKDWLSAYIIYINIYHLHDISWKHITKTMVEEKSPGLLSHPSLVSHPLTTSPWRPLRRTRHWPQGGCGCGESLRRAAGRFAAEDASGIPCWIMATMATINHRIPQGMGIWIQDIYIYI